MNALTEVGYATAGLAQTPHVDRPAPKIRSVEATDGSSLGSQEQGMMGSGDAVLELLHRSAEAFAELLTTLESAAAAAAMTGFTAKSNSAGLGSAVDEFA